ncbi:MAG: baseplate J/gp47 family protein [Eubacteriales bacterium]|nr:baseplate J/gp47 family protein [Eubacteriales bacterium]
MSGANALQTYPDFSFTDNISLSEVKDIMRDVYIKKYAEITGVEKQLINASTEAILLDTAAYMIYQSVLRNDYRGKMNTLKYATGEHLDELGAFKRVKRREGAAATTTLRFSLSEARLAATSIPKGTRVTAGDNVYFATNEYAEIPIGKTYADIVSTCQTTGIEGNNYKIGEINKFVDAVPFIATVSNTTVSEGGTERESDEKYRESIYAAPDGYTTGGSEPSYVWMCRKFSSAIEDVLVESPSPNNIKIWYTLEGGELPGSEFNKRLEEYLKDPERKILNDNITVSAPTTAEYNVNVKYFVARSATNRAEEIQNSVKKAVNEYILWQKNKIGRDINPDMLIKMIINAGAIRCEITSPARKVLDKTAIAKESEVSVIYGGLEDD